MVRFPILSSELARRLDFVAAFAAQLGAADLCARVSLEPQAGARVVNVHFGEGPVYRQRVMLTVSNEGEWVAAGFGFHPRVPDGTLLLFNAPWSKTRRRSEGEWAVLVAWSFMEEVLPKLTSVRRPPRRRRRKHAVQLIARSAAEAEVRPQFKQKGGDRP